MKAVALLLFAFLISPHGRAEYAGYGEVSLQGLARDSSWPYNRPGPSNAMVCNQRSAESYLTVRNCAGENCQAVRSFNRLAVIQVDTRYRDGNWVYVRGAYRNHDVWGRRLPDGRILPVQGWVHDGYLCDFLD